MGPVKVKIDVAITGTARFSEAWACEVKREARSALNHAGFSGLATIILTSAELREHLV